MIYFKQFLSFLKLCIYVSLPTIIILFLFFELTLRFVIPACQIPKFTYNQQLGFNAYEPELEKVIWHSSKKL